MVQPISYVSLAAVSKGRVARRVDRMESWEKIIAFRPWEEARRWERVDFPDPGEPDIWMKSLRGGEGACFDSGGLAISRVVGRGELWWKVSRFQAG